MTTTGLRSWTIGSIVCDTFVIGGIGILVSPTIDTLFVQSITSKSPSTALTINTNAGLVIDTATQYSSMTRLDTDRITPVSGDTVSIVDGLDNQVFSFNTSTGTYSNGSSSNSSINVETYTSNTGISLTSGGVSFPDGQVRVQECLMNDYTLDILTAQTTLTVSVGTAQTNLFSTGVHTGSGSISFDAGIFTVSKSGIYLITTNSSVLLNVAAPGDEIIYELVVSDPVETISTGYYSQFNSAFGISVTFPVTAFVESGATLIMYGRHRFGSNSYMFTGEITVIRII